MGSSGWMPTYAQTGAALMVGSVGVAMFHPEAVRYASYVSHASGRRGTGMGLFAVGGTAGWALGPLLLTGAVLAVGLRGTALVAVLPAVAAALLVVNHGYLERFRPDAVTEAREAAEGVNRWGVFGLAAGAASTRTGLQFGLQAFVPLYIWHVLETSEGVANASASVLMVFGAAGTLVGGRLADRIGFRRVVVRSLGAVVPLVLAITVTPLAGVFALMAMIGFTMEMNFYPLVVIAQTAHPAPRRVRVGRHPRALDRRRSGHDGAARRAGRREGPGGRRSRPLRGSVLISFLLAYALPRPGRSPDGNLGTVFRPMTQRGDRPGRLRRRRRRRRLRRACTCCTGCARLGLTARVFEAGGGVGGTWYWNRYPGARCDVESMRLLVLVLRRSCSRSGSGPSATPTQPEILRYLNHVADRFDLRRDIQFDTRVDRGAVRRGRRTAGR